MGSKRRWVRRRYLLDGEDIPSHKVSGSIHKARSTKSDECGNCMKPIEGGEEYVAMMDFDPYIFHVKCWFESTLLYKDDPNASQILAIGTKTVFDRKIWRKRTHVMCKRFTKKEVEDILRNNASFKEPRQT